MVHLILIVSGDAWGSDREILVMANGKRLVSLTSRPTRPDGSYSRARFIRFRNRTLLLGANLLSLFR